MKSFQGLELPQALFQSLNKMQFNKPTPIQAKAIPLALEGRDILGSAQTGTGKTAAFGVPLVACLMSDSKSAALVMTPTRELAKQVMVQLQALLGRGSKIRAALLIGGESMGQQFRQLRANPRLVVGTPGRINDHLKRRSLKLKQTNFLVLDETDRMLDMGFSQQLETIMPHLAPERQTLLFSATLPKNIVQLTKKYLKNPEHVAVSATSSPAENIKQSTLRVHQEEKYTNLLSELNQREGSIIIFVKTKRATAKMALKLSRQEGFRADAIHGDLSQSKRNRVIEAFRKQKYRILVATDVASRGLDIPHIEHVINYDLPQCAEDYIHRIGRTARAGAKGFALNFVTPADKGKWHAIDRLLNPNSAEKKFNRSKPRKSSKKQESRFKFFRKSKKSKRPANKFAA